MSTIEASEALDANVVDPWLIVQARMSAGATDVLEGDISRPEDQPSPISFFDVAGSALHRIATNARGRAHRPIKKILQDMHYRRQTELAVDMLDEALRPPSF